MSHPTEDLRVVVLISGTGSNCQAIIEQSIKPESAYQVVAVLSDRQEAAGLIVAASKGVPSESLQATDYSSREQFDAELLKAIKKYHPDLVVLAGFMRILTPKFVQHFTGRLMNIHPSLLPKYPGLNTHQRALEAGDTIHGASVHFVNEELDGGPVIAQARVPINPGDTVAALAARVLTQEHRLYPQIIELFAQKRLKQVDNQVSLDDTLISPLQL
ncbi:MAG TPA: phosphoribosylglycinamide formyltransferase [Gammaproteobacteria bacterium]|nr:phosphoribosylglycinamide formyltransferase [Gammaproteobacteria bacterium]